MNTRPNNPLRGRFLRWMSLSLFLIALAFASVGQAQAILLSIPAGSANFARLQPGETGEFTYTAQNRTANNLGSFWVAARFYPGLGSPGFLGGYSFQPEPGSRCSITETPARFGFNSLASQETVTCRITVTRAPTSRNDLLLFYCPFVEYSCPPEFTGYSNFAPILNMGDLPDVALASSIVTVPPGSTTAIVDIKVTNPSNRTISRTFFGTECAEFNGTGLVAPPFQIENDFAGACTSSTSSEQCYGGSATATQKLYVSEPVPANGAATCKLRLRFTSPLTSPQSLLMRTRTVVQFEDGIGYDLNPVNNETRFGAAPAELAVFVPVPTLSSLALLVLAVLLAGFSAMRTLPNWRQ
ncbi:MAG: hypothetical protein ABIP56_08525 [Dokdonella sp.]